MKRVREGIGDTIIAGLLIVLPLYLTGLLLLKFLSAVAQAVRPITRFLPESWPADNIVALLVILLVCLLTGLAVRTRAGAALQRILNDSVLAKVPGYTLIRSLTDRVVGQMDGTEWQPALVEIEEALVPAYIIEEIGDGRFAVFVPSVPTPLAGAIYIIDPERVHVVDMGFARAMRVTARWGMGSKAMVQAMRVPDRAPAGGATPTA